VRSSATWSVTGWGNFLAGGYTQVVNSGENNLAIVLGYALGTVGWLAGLGIFNDLFRQMAGKLPREITVDERSPGGVAKYFRYSLATRSSACSTWSGCSSTS